MFNQINVQVEARPDPETASLLGKHFCIHEREGTSRAGCAFFVYIWFSPVRIS